MNYRDLKLEKYQAHETKLMFARMSVPVLAANYIFYLLHVNKNAKKFLFCFCCYMVRSTQGQHMTVLSTQS